MFNEANESVAPLVSIVTPSLNMARYLPETIESVRAQDYPNVQYVIVDGGSTDGTIEEILPASGSAMWITNQSGGAAAAINEGFSRSDGEILGWISADDLYTPRAIHTAVAVFTARPDVDVVYGDGVWIDTEGERIGDYPTRDFSPALLGRECYLCQPAAFFRRTAFERVGGLDPKLQTAYDYDLWIRLSRESAFERVRSVLAFSRMHRSNKTIRERGTVLLEAMRLQKQYFGYVPMESVFSYVSWLADGRDQFCEPLRPGVRKYLSSLAVGLRWNSRHRIRFAGEWLRKSPVLLEALGGASGASR